MNSHSWKDTLLSVFSFLCQTICGSEEPPSGAQLENLTDETQYRFYLQKLLSDLAEDLQALFKIRSMLRKQCSSRACRLGCGTTEESFHQTLSIGIKTGSTVQHLLDLCYQIDVKDCSEAGCASGRLTTSYVLHPSKFIIVENSEPPHCRCKDGNSEGNTIVTIANNKYYLTAVVFKKNGNILLANSADGGAVPSPQSWYYGVYVLVE